MWAPDVGKGGGGALPLPSFLPFYFLVRAFSISRTRLSWSLEQATYFSFHLILSS